MQSDGAPPPTPPGIAPDRHVSLVFHDVVPETVPFDGLVPPAREHAEAIIDLARAWDGAAPLLIHCRFGVSRSPAAALIAAVAREPGRDPRALARMLRVRSPSATPNGLLIAHGDAALGLGGTLIDAVDDIGRGAPCMEGEMFALETR